MKREQAERIARKYADLHSSNGEDALTLVRAIDAIMEAVAIEREECAKVCDSVDNYANPMTARDCANAIRERAEQWPLMT